MASCRKNSTGTSSIDEYKNERGIQNAEYGRGIQNAEYGRGIRTRNTDAEYGKKLSKNPVFSVFEGLSLKSWVLFPRKFLAVRPGEMEILGTLQGLGGTS